MSKIPLVNDRWSKNKWIDYKGKILVIKKGLGNIGRYQYDGTSCLQGEVKGELVESVKIDSQWFDPDVWYKKTHWGNHYPERIYFSDPENPIMKSSSNFPTEAEWKRIDEKADYKSIPSAEILEQMISDLNIKTGKNYIFPFENKNYGEHWWEALVPLDLDGSPYLMTWENCD